MSTKPIMFKGRMVGFVQTYIPDGWGTPEFDQKFPPVLGESYLQRIRREYGDGDASKPALEFNMTDQQPALMDIDKVKRTIARLDAAARVAAIDMIEMKGDPTLSDIEVSRALIRAAIHIWKGRLTMASRDEAGRTLFSVLATEMACEIEKELA